MRTRRLGVAAGLASLASIALLLPASPATASSGAEAVAKDHNYRECGSQRNPGPGWYNVRVHETKCRLAKRRVASHVKNNPNDLQFNGWACEITKTHRNWAKANCIRTNQGRHQHVRFTLYKIV